MQKESTLQSKQRSSQIGYAHSGIPLSRSDCRVVLVMRLGLTKKSDENGEFGICSHIVNDMCIDWNCHTRDKLVHLAPNVHDSLSDNCLNRDRNPR